MGGGNLSKSSRRKPKKKSFLGEHNSENYDRSSNVDNFGSIYDGAAELVGRDVNTAKKILNELCGRLGM